MRPIIDIAYAAFEDRIALLGLDELCHPWFEKNYFGLGVKGILEMDVPSNPVAAAIDVVLLSFVSGKKSRLVASG